MKKIAIIGAGYAGITAACFLDPNKFEITVFETRKTLGGRAFSYFDKPFNTELDNGQHMLMGCYEKTMRLFKKLGIHESLWVQNRMHIDYFTKQTGFYNFRAMNHLPAPLHLLKSMLLDLKPLTFWERLGLLNVSLQLLFPMKKAFRELSVYEWLKRSKQNEKMIKFVWAPIAIGTMNDELEHLSAKTFFLLLKILFIQDAKNASVILFKKGLSEAIETEVKRYFDKNNIELKQEKVNRLSEQEKTYRIETSVATYDNFDLIISSVPYFQLNKLNETFNFKLNTQSILSVHFQYNGELFEQPFIGFPESWLEWIFNKEAFTDQKGLYSCVTSAANKYLALSKEELTQKFLSEIKQLFPKFNETALGELKFIHEKRATFCDSVEPKPHRPTPGHYDKNLFLCGDWTATDFPSTIEGACKSAMMCIAEIKNNT